MTSRERVLAAINHQESDRVPIEVHNIMADVPPENIVAMFAGVENLPIRPQTNPRG